MVWLSIMVKTLGFSCLRRSRVVGRSRNRGDRRKAQMNGRTAFVGEVRGSGCSPVTHDKPGRTFFASGNDKRAVLRTSNFAIHGKPMTMTTEMIVVSKSSCFVLNRTLIDASKDERHAIRGRRELTRRYQTRRHRRSVASLCYLDLRDGLVTYVRPDSA